MSQIGFTPLILQLHWHTNPCPAPALTSDQPTVTNQYHNNNIVKIEDDLRPAARAQILLSWHKISSLKEKFKCISILFQCGKISKPRVLRSIAWWASEDIWIIWTFNLVFIPDITLALPTLGGLLLLSGLFRYAAQSFNFRSIKTQ